jgi:hypothetical protein
MKICDGCGSRDISPVDVLITLEGDTAVMFEGHLCQSCEDRMRVELAGAIERIASLEPGGKP